MIDRGPFEGARVWGSPNYGPMFKFRGYKQKRMDMFSAIQIKRGNFIAKATIIPRILNHHKSLGENCELHQLI